MSGSMSDIPLGVKVPQPPDMLQSALRIGALANYANQNKLFQSHQLAGQIAQQAIDPETGQLDTVKANRLLAGAGPDVSLAAQDMLANNEARAGGNMKLATAKLGVIGNALDALRFSDVPLTKARVMQTMDNLRTLGFQIPDMSASMPDDPAALRDRANQAAEQVRNIEARIKQAQGDVTGTDTGTGTQYNQTQYPQGSGTPTMRPVAGGFVGNKSPTTFPGKGGANITTTRENAPAVIEQQSGAAPALPPGLRNPNRPGAAAPGGGAAAAPTGGPAAIVGPTPQEKSAAEATGTDAAGMFGGYRKDASTATNQITTFTNMQSDKTGFVGGPGTDFVKKFQSTIQSWAPRLAPILGIDADRIAKLESFDKLAAAAANAQGAQSDHRLDTVLAANPNSHLTDAGVDLILKQLTGNAEYLAARSRLAAAWPNKADHDGFQAAVLDNLDPRAFQLARMDEKQQREYFLGLPKGDRDNVKAAYNWAQSKGLIR